MKIDEERKTKGKKGHRYQIRINKPHTTPQNKKRDLDDLNAALKTTV
jgi:hypothetical protein